jgi:hypothetical protein
VEELVHNVLYQFLVPFLYAKLHINSYNYKDIDCMQTILSKSVKCMLDV